MENCFYNYASNISFCKINNIYFIINEHNNRYYLLEGVASDIWEYLEGNSILTISAKIVEKYNIDMKTSVSDVNDLLISLLSAKLIERKN